MIVSLLSSRKVERAEISLTFVGTQRIRRLNREYLGRDRQTDVIAFDLSGEHQDDKSGRDLGSPLIGDIYVCVPLAVKQAAEYGVSVEEELFRLATHGLLHLLGYHHETESEFRQMNCLQEQLVEKFSSGRLD